VQEAARSRLGRRGFGFAADLPGAKAAISPGSSAGVPLAKGPDMRPPLLSIVSLAAVLCVASPAFAQPALAQPIPRDAPAGPPVEVHRYWALTLGVDAAAVGTMALGAALEGPDGRDTSLSEAAVLVGLAGASFGVPTVHALRGNWRSAGLSLLLRAAIPSLTTSIAIATTDCEELLCELDAVVPGYLIGLGVASLVDAGLLAREERAVRPPVWSPVVGYRPGGGQLGIVASF
jgi:hypothetical protein